jgi:RNA polymerase sigma factor (sigma-70 family)
VALSNPSLSATVGAATLGDELAWNELVRQFTPILRSVAKGYRLAPHDIDDVVQTCWLSLFGSLHRLRDPEAVGGWLVTTARRNALRALQRDVHELPVDAPLLEEHAASDCVETAVMEAERDAILRAALRRLPRRQRALLEVLLADPGRSYAEVSVALDMPVGSIGPTRKRGLKRLGRDQRLAAVAAP